MADQCRARENVWRAGWWTHAESVPELSLDAFFPMVKRVIEAIETSDQGRRDGGDPGNGFRDLGRLWVPWARGEGRRLAR